MGRILMLARHFPPIGGAGVHRTVGSVMHLPAHGHEPVVVTGAAEHRDRWEPRDEQLLERIPAGVPVHRIAPDDPTPPSRLGRVIGVGPRWVRAWVRESAGLGVQIGRDADVVYASCLPYETAFAAARVARELGRPWVADLEDPWALDEMRIMPSMLHRARDLRRMRRALSTASAIIMSAPEAASRVRAEMPELASRVVSIPIGYEPQDFQGVEAPPPDGVFRIVHTGSLHTDLGEHLRRTRTRRRLLGGTAPGIDVLTRSHVFLAQAIGRVLAAEPDLRVELHLVGELTAADRASIANMPFIRSHGLVGHRETLALMRRADLLFLPMHDLPRGQRAGLIPYKTYEYLAARRPILAAVPDGDVRDMLAPLSHVSLVRPSDIQTMAEVLTDRVAAAREPNADQPVAPTRAQAVERIAGLLDVLLRTAPRTSRGARSAAARRESSEARV